jgi:aryl-alcohol dehydrogenase-like predicted oxidoreductase
MRGHTDRFVDKYVASAFVSTWEQGNAIPKLGASDLLVSEISLGSWLTYGVAIDRDRAVACIDRAFDLGINFIDTANAYGRGAAESLLGEFWRADAQFVCVATRFIFR